MITVEPVGLETSLNIQAKPLKVSLKKNTGNLRCPVTLWSGHTVMSVRFHSNVYLEGGKKSLPMIPGINSAPGTMIYAGSIGTQIANELMDFNRFGVRTFYHCKI